MRKSKSLFFVTLLVYLFLIGPLLVIMAASFSDTTYLKFPDRKSCGGISRFCR